MVFVGKVFPRYITRGTLPDKFGSFDLARETPLRMIYYTGPGTNRYISWQNIAKEVTVASDSVVELSPQIIDSAIHPQAEPAGALLLHRGQMQERAWGILNLAGEKFRSDLAQYSQWLVLLPELKQDGREVLGFDLGASRAGNSEINALLGGFTDDVVDSELMFINPYYGGKGFFSGGFELTREMSALLGRRVINSVAARLKIPLRDEVVACFAAAYTRVVAEDFLDISLAYGLPDFEEKRPLLKELDIQARALRSAVNSREAAAVARILNG